jgi:G6PDH family F420-dependent oxidoreductase
VAARVGQGFITTKPLADHVELYRRSGGSGTVVGTCKFCWSEDEKAARREAWELWPTEAMSGQLAQELPMPAHFEQASQMVTEAMVAAKIPCGPDATPYIEAIRRFAEAGFDELYINQIGKDHGGFFKFYNREVRPNLS